MRRLHIFAPLALLTLAACTSNDASVTKDAGTICGGAPGTFNKTFEKSVSVPNTVNLDDDSVIIYYAVDTKERFMQAAVDEDIRSLRAACELTPNESKKARMNWVAFVNSHFVDGKPSFLMCDAGVFSEKAYPEATMNALQPILAKAQNPATYASYPANIVGLKVDGYSKFPFANAKVLGKMLSLSRKLFDPASHVFHLHIKSHGSSALALTGLTDEQTLGKDNCQKDILTAKNIELPAVEFGQAGVKRTGDGSVLTLGEGGEVTLGENGQVILGENGQVILGDSGQVILGDGGQIILGDNGQIILGDEMGLGASTHFGASLNEVMAELSNFVQSNAGLRMGYVILEGCYSAGGQNFLATVMPFIQTFIQTKVARIYAAHGSLWYRNFEWSQYLTGWMAEDAAASSAKLVGILDERAASVVNWQKAE